MSKARSIAIRERIYDLHTSGQSALQISKTLDIPLGTIKQLCRRFKQLGKDGILPSYHNCGQQSVLRLSEQKSKFLSLKEKHSAWGAPRLRLEQELLNQSEAVDKANYADKASEKLPSVRTLNRWYREAGLTKIRKQRSEVSIGRSQAPHNIWQVDAKERLNLPDGTTACYLTITDEKTGAWLEAPVFPLSPDQSGTS